MTELWVQDDPYKHRAMRINGVAEHFITGDASPKEKFFQWARTLPNTVGNPLFHWTCLELKRVFGVSEVLNEQNAGEIWEHCNHLLQQEGFGAADIVKSWNAEVICTSDELLDDLTDHALASKINDKLQVSPSLRCDAALALDHTTPAYLSKLSASTGIPIQQLHDFKAALLNRLDHFHLHGCRLADHALDAGFYFSLPSETEAENSFSRLLLQEKLPTQEVISLRSYLLVFLGTEYSKRNWAMQLHIGAQRFTSSRLRSLAGAAGGYACIGTTCDMASLCSFLDALEVEHSLPRTILYTLNPADNEAFASLTGSFAEDGVPGKIQFGPAWWYNDQAEGIRKQLIALSSYGLLSRFIGMTTDSRSILSLSRHEYFRRILCNLLGGWVEAGEVPDDDHLLRNLVTDVCYRNIRNRVVC